MQIPEISLPCHIKSVRSYAGMQGFPLSEIDMPYLIKKNPTPEEIEVLLDYLNVEGSPRYAKIVVRDKNNPSIIIDVITFCNTYFHDYCQLRKRFSFRNWWHEAIIKKGNFSIKRYGNIAEGGTFGELNANMLFDVFEKYGNLYGWKKVSNETELQNTVNDGAVGCIMAKNVDPAKPGHVDIVIPEWPEKNRFALRDKSGIVICPLQSQAGGINKKIFCDLWGQWYKAKEFGGQYSFWVNV